MPGHYTVLRHAFVIQTATSSAEQGNLLPPSTRMVTGAKARLDGGNCHLKASQSGKQNSLAGRYLVFSVKEVL